MSENALTLDPGPDRRRPRPVVTPEEWVVILERHRLWLERHSGEQARRANLSRRSLAGLDLRNARLDRAILRDCDLSGLDLSATRFYGADLSRSDLRGADLSGNRQMDKVRLERARLDGAQLVRVRLSEVRARGARFDGANLTDADLSRADLRDTTWSGATLDRAVLTQTDLRQSDLRGVGGVGWWLGLWRSFWPACRVPFTLDETRVHGARFSTSSQDPWSVLRRTYTGPRLIFVLILSVTALLPLMIQAALYRALDQAERLALPAAVAAVRRSAEVVRARLPRPGAFKALDAATEARFHRARDWLGRVDTSLRWLDRRGMRWDLKRLDPNNLRALLNALEEAEDRITDVLEANRDAAARRADRAANLPGPALDNDPLPDALDRAIQARRLLRVLVPETRIRIEPVPIWWLLLGFDRGWWTAVLASALLLYNVLRLVLTYMVSPLRDEEERSGHAPARDAYLWMYRFGHRTSSVLMGVALVSGMVQFFGGMTAEVLIPRFPKPAARAVVTSGLSSATPASARTSSSLTLTTCFSTVASSG